MTTRSTSTLSRSLTTLVTLTALLAGTHLSSKVWAQDAYPPPPNAVRQVQRLSIQELDQMLAPIALYPDNVLGQILIAATYPLDIVEAHRWREAAELARLDETARAIALDQADWDPAVKAIAAQGDLIAMMDRDLTWTRRLGDAFLTQREDVMDAVQRLRARARANGQLRANGEVAVRTESNIIVIEPASPDLIYIPSYDPISVYGPWPWNDYPPVIFPTTRVIIGFNFGRPAPFWGRHGFGPPRVDWRRRDLLIDEHRWNRDEAWRRDERGPARQPDYRPWRPDPDRRDRRPVVPVVTPPGQPGTSPHGVVVKPGWDSRPSQPGLVPRDETPTRNERDHERERERDQVRDRERGNRPTNPVVNPPLPGVTNPPLTNPPLTNPPITRPPIITQPVTTPPATTPPATTQPWPVAPSRGTEPGINFGAPEQDRGAERNFRREVPHGGQNPSAVAPVTPPAAVPVMPQAPVHIPQPTLQAPQAPNVIQPPRPEPQRPAEAGAARREGRDPLKQRE